MRLAIRHLTRYAYDAPVARVALRLKLYPPQFRTQKPTSWRVAVNGAAVEAAFATALGEGESVWTSSEPSAAIEILAEGVVQADDANGLVSGLCDVTRPAMYLRQTPLTSGDQAIEDLAASVRKEGLLGALHHLSDAVGDAVEYRTSATKHGATAAEALAQGAGVCQDHAHVFIAAARAMKIPARYVTGYLATDDDAASQTHAWAEAFVPDLGWVGFDPSNRQCPTDAYVRLCAGFDAADAAPIRGAVSAAAGEAMSVQVQVAQQ